MNKFRRDTLCRALLAAGSAETAYFDTLPEVKQAHSSAYLNAIQELKTSGAPRSKVGKGKLIALIISATVLLALVTSCAFSDKVRQFFIEIFDDSIYLTPTNKDTVRIEETRVPGYVPEGFEFTEFNPDPLTIAVRWNKGVEEIYFQQCTLINGGIGIDTEGGYTVRTLGGYEGFFVERFETYGFTWSDGKYYYSLTCPSNVGIEEFEKIIYGIVEYDYAPPIP